MSFRTLVLRSLAFHWRSHAAVLFGIAVAASTLVGALLVGDSVRGTLRERALARLAGTHYALSTHGRMFTEELGRSVVAPDPARGLAGSVPLLYLPGAAARADGEARANKVQVWGVDHRFWEQAGNTNPPALKPGEVLLSRALATQLKCAPGEEIILRMPKPGLVGSDAVLGRESQASKALRLTCAGVLEPKVGGNLSLVSRGADPFNAFVALADLQNSLSQTGRINTILTGPIAADAAPAAGGPPQLQKELARRWTLDDAALRWVTTPTGLYELRSTRVFLDPVAEEAAVALGGSNTVVLLTYLANLLVHGTNATPYSIVTAAGPPYTPIDLREDEIVVNAWLAEDLQLRTGSEVDLVYFLPDSGANLREATNRFKVREIVALDGVYTDRTLMPDFPGLEKAEKPGDWETGFELTYRIRPKDDQYWKNYRGTPKAFLSPAAGRKLWTSRFGEATAVRLAVAPETRAQVEADFRGRLTPEMFGLQFAAVREEALKGAAAGQDFGQLFIGFSFFLVLAALILMAMLFQFGLEQRAGEAGLLRAVGFSAKWVGRWRLAEGLALALVGSALGLAGGFLYAKALVHGMRTIWRDAIGSAHLDFYWSTASLCGGFAAGAVVSLATLFLGWRRQTRAASIQLLAMDSGIAPVSEPGRRWPRWVAACAFMVSLGLLVAGLAKPEVNSGIFFGAGGLLILAGILGGLAGLRRLGRQGEQHADGLAGLAWRGCARRAGRSLAVITLLALGTFLIGSIGVFRLDAQRGVSPGTGGFGLIAESAAPITRDLTSTEGREAAGLANFPRVGVVPFRVQPGDEANCLNLTRALKPTLMGVNSEALAGRFKFAAALKGGSAGWDLLQRGTDEAIPAIGDANSIQWSMGRKLGDTIDYVDERGRPFKVRIVGALANSILQGSLVIDEREWLRRFPGQSGWRFFLLDTPATEESAVAAALSRALQDEGLEVTSAVARLNAFNAVQNTYLSTFQVLGALGLLLGSAGLGAILLRNVLERRPELALLRAVGFLPARIQKLIVGEHLMLAGFGLGLGCAAAAVAVLPAWLARGTPLPYDFLLAALAAVTVNALAWTWAAATYALRGDLLPALRDE